MTSIEIDGAGLDTFQSFADAVARALGVEYFGWDLNSFQDCLQGGYGGVGRGRR